MKANHNWPTGGRIETCSTVYLDLHSDAAAYNDSASTQKQIRIDLCNSHRRVPYWVGCYVSWSQF